MRPIILSALILAASSASAAPPECEALSRATEMRAIAIRALADIIKSCDSADDPQCRIAMNAREEMDIDANQVTADSILLMSFVIEHCKD